MDATVASLEAEVAALKADKAHAWEVNAELKGELFSVTTALEAANSTISQVKTAFGHFTGWLKDYGRAAWVVDQSVDNISNALDN